MSTTAITKNSALNLSRKVLAKPSNINQEKLIIDEILYLSRNFEEVNDRKCNKSLRWSVLPKMKTQLKEKEML